MNLEQQILNDLLKGELPPGTKLNIAELKQQYEVGLAPLREALSRLVSTGLLENVHNKGFYVTSVSEQDCRETYKAYAHLETLALSQAMDKGGAEWEEDIVAALYRLGKLEMAEELPSFEDWYRANQRFHDSLVAGCSPVVKELRSLLFLRMTRYVYIAFKGELGGLEGAHALHKELADTVLSGDKEVALELLNKHHLEGLKSFENSFK